MGILRRKKFFRVIGVLLLVLVVWLIFRWLVPVLSLEQLRSFVEGLGFLGPLAIILYIVVSHVLAPLVGMPALLAGVAVFGVFKTWVFIYLGSLVSSVVSFYISRKLGRRWVVRLVGRRTMDDVDKFAESSGTAVLILGRVFGFSLFDVISYAAGLTTISFRRYFLITLIFPLVPGAIFVYFFKDIGFSSWYHILAFAGGVVFAGLIFSFFVWRFVRRGR